MNIKRTLNALIVVLLMTFAALPMAGAASEPQILQQRLEQPQDLSGATLTLYVRHTGGAAISKINIGGIDIENATITENASQTELVTWILFDNSTSMPEAIRTKASDLLITLLGEKGRGERYNFCTFSDKLSIKLRDSNNFVDLKKYVDAIEYYDQPTYLMGAVDEVLTDVANHRSDNDGLVQFIRILVISAGGDSIPTGKTMENLRDRLTASKSIVSSIPIYTIGCNNGENGEILQQMYELSKGTYARYWNMDEVGASDIAKIMRWEEIPLTASMALPGNDSLTAGTEQAVTVTFDNGESARGSIIMPTIVKSNTPPPPPPSINVGKIVLIVVIVLVLAGAGAAVFLILRRKEEPVRSTGDPVPVRAPDNHYDGGNDAPTDWVDENEAGDETIDIFGDSGGDSYRTLYLKDTDSPDRQFSASLRNRVTIGRSPDNVISLGYDKSISRRHCEIYYQNGDLWIQDVGSSGGTYIGSDRVVNAMELPNGSNIRLGHVNYRVEVR